MSERDSIVQARLASRESSTLSFASLGASSSLVVLALTVERGLDISYPWLKIVGILFASLGIVYREVTFLSLDIYEPRLASETLRTALRLVRNSDLQQMATFIRRFAIRYFLNLPILGWLAFIFPSVANNFCLSLVVAAIPSIILSRPNLVPR